MNATTPARWYAELRALAGFHLARERSDHTLQPTALAHEAFLRLAAQSKQNPGDKARFLAVASEMIRRILVDHARQKNSIKRGGKWRRLILDEVSLTESGTVSVDILELDEALKELAKHSQRQARVVELRFFGGLSLAETADLLGVSIGSVKGDWRFARAWLRVRLDQPT